MMPRRLANGLTLLSAVVCVLSLTLVGRSFVRTDAVQVSTVKERVTCAVTTDGELWLVHATGSNSLYYSSEPSATTRADARKMRRSFRGFPRLGIGWSSVLGWKYLIVPLWLLPLLTAIAPMRWWRKRRREAGRGFPIQQSAAAAA